MTRFALVHQLAAEMRSKMKPSEWAKPIRVEDLVGVSLEEKQQLRERQSADAEGGVQ